MAVVKLIAATTTGLRVASTLDTHPYAKDIKIADAQISDNPFHPE